MGLNHSPAVVASNLVLCLDAANSNSYTVATPLSVEYLIVGGGGGGGGGSSTSSYTGGGGGGGGGFRTGFIEVTPQSYTVTVGNGGTGGAYNVVDNSGTSGEASSFAGISAAGGGGGGAGGNATAAARIGKSGGSGGGSGYRSTVGGTGNTPITSPSQGNNGGFAGTGEQGSGGGGGAGAIGADGTNLPQYTGGAGGIGLSSSISGTTQFYAGGGGAGGLDLGIVPSGFGAVGGLGGGGGGGFLGTSPTVYNGQNGLENTGGGGGGGTRHTVSNVGGNGGSGIVIIRYIGTQRATGGTVTSANGYTIHTFTTSGTFVVNNTSTWQDISGRGNNGTLTNNPGFSSTNSGSLAFNGTNQQVIVPSSQAFSSAVTIETWFSSVKATRHHLWNIGIGSGANTLSCDLNDSGFTLWIYWQGGGGNYLRFTTPSLSDGVIRQLVFVHDNNTNLVYLNGTLLAGGSSGGTQTFTTVSGDIYIASAGSALYTQGNVYNYKVYNAALTAEQVNQNFQALRGRFGI